MKNKIHKYDFLIVGAGLLGTIAALALIKKKLKVLVIDKMNNKFIDNRTLAVNANSIEFLRNLGVWDDLKSKPQLIEKIVIDDNINKGSIIFENNDEAIQCTGSSSLRTAMSDKAMTSAVAEPVFPRSSFSPWLR